MLCTIRMQHKESICCKVCLLGWQCSSQLRKSHLFPPQIAKGCVVKPDPGARIRTSLSSCGASTSLASRPSKPRPLLAGKKSLANESSQFCNVVLLYDMLWLLLKVDGCWRYFCATIYYYIWLLYCRCTVVVHRWDKALCVQMTQIGRHRWSLIITCRCFWDFLQVMKGERSKTFKWMSSKPCAARSFVNGFVISLCGIIITGFVLFREWCMVNTECIEMDDLVPTPAHCKQH